MLSAGRDVGSTALNVVVDIAKDSNTQEQKDGSWQFYHGDSVVWSGLCQILGGGGAQGNINDPLPGGRRAGGTQMQKIFGDN